MESNKVIMFPSWKKQLEEESLAAIKSKRFEEALDKLNELLHYKVNTHEIYTGKLICLMELERFEEAQNLCESLVSVRDSDYYLYVHIYLTLLFQTNQYNLLMEVASEALENDDVPQNLREPFQELYTMSENMQEDLNKNLFTHYLDDLFIMVNQENHQEQWRIIHKLRKLAITPNDKVISLLVNEIVHPVNKSAIFLWMKEIGVKDKINVHKFGIQLNLIPIETKPMKLNQTASDIHKKIQELDQINPTVYRMVEKLFEHYLLVLYPIIPEKKDTTYIAEALIAVGNEYINQNDKTEEPNDKVLRYIQEIKTCTVLYSSIIDE